MPEKSKKDEAHSQFQKLQRAEDGKKAMSEYESEGVALRAKTERLKALRLANAAVAEKAAPKKAVAKKRSAKAKKGPSGSLSDWLKDRDGGGHRN